MADLEEESCFRFQKILNDVEDRVEKLREQAQSLQTERESLLEVLQDVQDNANCDKMTEGVYVMCFRDKQNINILLFIECRFTNT